MVWQKLSKDIGRCVRSAGVEQRADEALAVDYANEAIGDIIGTEASQKAKAERVLNGALVIHCQDGHIATQIQFNERSIIKHIKQKAGAAEIRSVRIRH